MIYCSGNSQIKRRNFEFRERCWIKNDGRQEFLSTHGEVSVMNVAEVISKSNFLNILIDGSTIHGKVKESIYIQWFQRKEFMARENTTVTLLLNLPDAQDASVNLVAFKAGFVRSFDLIKEHCMDDNSLTKIILNCEDRALTNMRSNNNLFTCLVEEHSHLIPFWCIIR